MHWPQVICYLILIGIIIGAVSMPTHAWDFNGPVRGVAVFVFSLLIGGLYLLGHWLIG